MHIQHQPGSALRVGMGDESSRHLDLSLAISSRVNRPVLHNLIIVLCHYVLCSQPPPGW